MGTDLRQLWGSIYLTLETRGSKGNLAMGFRGGLLDAQKEEQKTVINQDGFVGQRGPSKKNQWEKLEALRGGTFGEN